MRWVLAILIWCNLSGLLANVWSYHHLKREINELRLSNRSWSDHPRKSGEHTLQPKITESMDGGD